MARKRKESFEERHRDSISRGKVVLIGVCLVAIVATYIRNDQRADQIGDRVTRVESPCLRYGSDSRQCREAFEAALLSLTHAQACAIERKAGTLKAIRELAAVLDTTFTEPCAGARLAQERKRERERDRAAAKREAAGGGGAEAGDVGEIPSSGGSDGGSGPVDPDPSPGKGGSGDPKAPGQGGGGGDPAPADPAPATPPVVQPPTAAEPEAEAPPPDRNVLAPTLEGVQKGVGEVVGGVGGTAEQVGCKLKGTC